MSFQVDGTITYTQQGKINCTIVDIENKQKYTIEESGITKTETISDEDREKLISGSQSGDVISNEADSTGVDVKEETDISSDGNTIATSVTDEKSGTQDTVAENINRQIKDKKILGVTNLEFVRNPDVVVADADAQKIAADADDQKIAADADAQKIAADADEKGSGAAAADGEGTGTGTGEGPTVIATGAGEGPTVIATGAGDGKGQTDTGS